jgi:hypothetical protein
MANDNPVEKTSSRAVTEFLAVVKRLPVKPDRGTARLVFALDATASREATWDQACSLHGEMFEEASASGNLAVQLCYYRGLGEFHASNWVEESEALLGHMVSTRCAAGRTQIGKLLNHIKAETNHNHIRAAVFIGDAFEEELDDVAQTAGELGLLGCPLFMFQEGKLQPAKDAFTQLAKLSGGAYCQFDSGSVQQLRDLMRGVAAYAAGGRGALVRLAQTHGNKRAQLLADQIRPS